MTAAILSNRVHKRFHRVSPGQLHSGDGSCFSTIPVCPNLPQITNGVLKPLRKGAENLPGVVREYACKDGFYVKGTSLLCTRTGAWDAKYVCV